ncbi:hypothetical protein, partial [Actinocorallia lasiicapitis]
AGPPAARGWTAPLPDTGVWVDADATTLLLRGTGSACDRSARVEVAETDRAVRIKVTRSGVERTCPLIGVFRTFAIDLSAPLGDRRIVDFADRDYLRLKLRPAGRGSGGQYEIPVETVHAAAPVLPRIVPKGTAATAEGYWADPSGTVLVLNEPVGQCVTGVSIAVDEWARSIRLVFRHTPAAIDCPDLVIGRQYRIALRRPLNGRIVRDAKGQIMQALPNAPTSPIADEFRVLYR